MVGAVLLLILSILIFIVAGFCLFAFIFMLAESGWCEECGGAMVACVVFAILGVGCLHARGAVIKKYNAYRKHIADILSISRENGLEGSFVLGCGYVEDVQYYLYYHKTDKGIKLDKIESENSYIVETNKIKPSIYEVKEKCTMDVYYNIYVPVGTVVTSYVLN